MPGKSVFISYSHRDEEWKDLLLRHLAVSLDPDSLQVWDDTRIPSGSEWRKELEGAIADADLAILLVSADFLASQFVKEVELPTLLDRSHQGMDLLPVLVRPCAWRTVDWLARRQVLPADGIALSAGDPSDVEQGLATVTEAVTRLLATGAPTPEPEADRRATG